MTRESLQFRALMDFSRLQPAYCGHFRGPGAATARNTGTLAAFTDELRLLLAVLTAARLITLLKNDVYKNSY